jgi:hypothetical protein
MKMTGLYVETRVTKSGKELFVVRGPVISSQCGIINVFRVCNTKREADELKITLDLFNRLMKDFPKFKKWMISQKQKGALRQRGKRKGGRNSAEHRQ